jgi:hypothetical protein
MLRLTPVSNVRVVSLELLAELMEDVFEHVTIDREEGESEKNTNLAVLQRLGAPEELVARRTTLEDALVTLEEPEMGEEAYVSFLYFPGEEIIIGFSGPTHEQQGSQVAFKLAEELGYVVAEG